jgi:hypothetical protein
VSVCHNQTDRSARNARADSARSRQSRRRRISGSASFAAMARAMTMSISMPVSVRRISSSAASARTICSEAESSSRASIRHASTSAAAAAGDEVISDAYASACFSSSAACYGSPGRNSRSPSVPATSSVTRTKTCAKTSAASSRGTPGPGIRRAIFAHNDGADSPLSRPSANFDS